MEILVTGGSGFIGSALCSLLKTKGHRVFVYTRNPSKAALNHSLDGCTLLSSEDDFPQVEVIVNLAGASISSFPLTARQLRKLLDSRLHMLGLLKQKYEGRSFPSLLIQASATSVYRQDSFIDEHTLLSDSPEGLLSQTVERAAQDLCAGRGAVAIARIGMVVGPRGGIVKALRYFPPFKIWGRPSIMPWLTLTDCAKALTFIAEHRLEGIYNLTSPRALTLNSVLKLAHPARFRLPVPAFVVKLDSRSRLLFFNGYVKPAALLKQGFSFNN